MLGAVQSLATTMQRQQELLTRVLTEQESMKELHQRELERQREKEERSKTSAMIDGARREAEGEKVRSQNSNVLRAMVQRLEKFEEILRADRGDRRQGPETVIPQVPTSPNAVEMAPTGETDPLPAGSLSPPLDGSPEKTPGAMPTDLKEVIKKLEENSMAPKEIFAAALKEYEEREPEEWARSFPPGYRERLSPMWLGEIYASGKTAKQWGKDWLALKGLGDSHEARDILPTLATVDTIFLHDKQPGAINMISTERLGRKGYGIITAFRDVKKREDWQKPSGQKSWTTKVDYEGWRRVDPLYEDREHLFVNRKVEEEVRQEMDRDAAMLKAKNKLTAQSKGGT